MARYLDQVPFSGIIRIRDMMYSVERPFRLDQGDVSFDAPDSVKAALVQRRRRQPHALRPDDRHSAARSSCSSTKMRAANGIPDRQPGRGHGHVRRHSRRLRRRARDCSSRATRCSCPIRSGRRRQGNISCAHAVPVPLSAARVARLAAGRRRDAPARHAEDARDLRQLAQQPDRRRAHARRSRGDRRARARARSLGALRRGLRGRASSTATSTISIASLPGMYERTIPLYTFSKTYAMTGLRLGYLAVTDATIRDRVRKMLFYTVSNTSSLDSVRRRRRARRARRRSSRSSGRELAARRDLFYAGIATAGRRHLHRHSRRPARSTRS